MMWLTYLRAVLWIIYHVLSLTQTLILALSLNLSLALTPNPNPNPNSNPKLQRSLKVTMDHYHEVLVAQ